MQTLRIMGVDPGRRHVGYAVIADQLLTMGVWRFSPDIPPLLLPALVRHQVQTLLRRYRVEVLAIEDWVWQGRFVSEAPYVTRLIGALETLAMQVLVVECPAGEWMRALMGYLPSPDPMAGSAPWMPRLSMTVMQRAWPYMPRGCGARAAVWEISAVASLHGRDADGSCIDMTMRGKSRSRRVMSQGRIPMTRYAEYTEVPAERSRGEIERTLTRYGATRFVYGWQDEAAVVAFELRGRQVKFVLPLPSKASRAFTYTPGRKLLRTPEQALQAWEQATRQCWRALALIIKAKLEAVRSGVTTFEDEFSSRFMLPSGNTVGQWLHPQLVRVYETQHMPPILPLPEHLE